MAYLSQVNRLAEKVDELSDAVGQLPESCAGWDQVRGIVAA
jgi:hypothetical protein